MSEDTERQITDEMKLSELTVGEFKALLRELLASPPVEVMSPVSEEKIQAKVTVRRKSLDEFMSDLG